MDYNNFFKTSDGCHIHYEEYGEGKPIVLIHGYLCSGSFFKNNIEGLSKENRLITVDLRTHGDSQNTLDNLTIDRCATDLKELFDYLELEDIFLLGWSMGGSVVMSYFKQYGDHRISSLGLVDSVLNPYSHEDFNPHHLKGFNTQKMRDTVYLYMNYFDYCNGFANGVFGKDPEPEVHKWIANEMSKCPPWCAFTIYNDFAINDYSPVLDEINIPLYLAGANSRTISTAADMMKYFHERTKNYSKFYDFTEDGVGHMMFYERPEKFNGTILNFLSETR